MNQAITVSPKTIEEILAHLNTLTKEVKEIKAKLFEKEPPYGSDEWWKWSIKKGTEDVKKGNYIEFDSVEELQRHLDSLK